MALTSFSLRKQTSGFGSYLQQPGAMDSALQSTGISSARLTTGENTFSANILTKGVVRLEWTLEEPLVDIVTVGAQPVELQIISSASGEPVTINDGVFVKSITSNTLNNYYDDTPVISEGRWVYYSLFVKNSDGSSYWFTRVATLYIQIPISYNSVESLWSKIPEYYRELDYRQDILENGYSPLYAFVELFGNEVDRTRTLIESVAIANDPEIAVTPALSALAYETGLEVNIDDLGTSKVRTLLNNIGTLRQQKGTIGSICSYISAMSGCPVTYTYNAALPKPHVFSVYAQRVNFISDPMFENVTITTSSGTVTQNGTTYNARLQTTTTWGVYTYGTGTIGASNPAITDNANGITITMPPGSYANRTVMVYPRKPFPYLGTKLYGTSYDYTGSAGASFSALRTATNTTRLAWEAGVAGGSMPPNIFADDAWYDGTKYAYTSIPARPSLEYVPPSNNRTNLINNSSFETNTTGWAGSNITLATSTSFAYSNISSLRGTITTTGTNRFIDKTLVDVTGSTVYSYSCWVYLPVTNTADTTWKLQLFEWNGTSYHVAYTLQTATITRGVWTRLSGSITTAATTISVQPRVIHEASIAAGQVVYIDAALLETGSTLLPYFEGTTLGASTTVSSVPVLSFTMAPGSSISINNWLFEPSTNGHYFSGSTRDGGYIPIQDGTTGGGTFDYYWDTAGTGVNNAYSFYLQDHERTIKTTERVIAQYIAPVTMLALYSIAWDYYPGK